MQAELLPRQVLDWVAMLERMQESERAGLLRHYLALGPEDRRLRFGLSVSDEFIVSYVERVDFANEVVFGVCSGAGEWLGIGHISTPGVDAELGLSVLEHARGKGLGGAIFRFAVAHAARNGVHRLFMHFLTRNKAILALARSAGMEIRSEAGESDAHLVVPSHADFVRMLIAASQVERRAGPRRRRAA